MATKKHRSSYSSFVLNPKPSRKEILHFLIPSLFGIAFFLFPIYWDGNINILIGIFSESLAELISPVASTIITFIITLSGIIALITLLFKPNFILRNHLLTSLFNTSNYYLIVRLFGAATAIMCYFQVGPSIFISTETGGTMMTLLGTLIAWFFAASFLIPLLMNFGIMEYVGTFIKDFTRPLFKLPGRSTIDLLASWIGNCNVGVVLTTTQYEKGYYTAREAITIATCFSAVSLPFALVITAMLGVDSKFLPFYLITAITGVLSVIIMIRIPPLKKYPNEYYLPVGKQVDENHPEGIKKAEWALKLAVDKAKTTTSFSKVLYEGFEMFMGIIFTLTPIVMCYGTIALILANYTPIFDWLSLPFGYYLDFLGVEEAFKAAPATIAGFADMIIPAILGASVGSFQTRFIIGVLSLVQIVYMTEVGTLIITSKLPIGFTGLLVLFLEKTIISLPIIVLLTKLFGI